MLLSRARAFSASVVLVAPLVACGDSTPPARPPTSASVPSASASLPLTAPEPPDDPVPALRTGAVAPEDAPGVQDLPLVARSVGDGYEILAAEMPPGPSSLAVVAADVPPGQPTPLAFVAPQAAPWQHPPKGRPALLWLRRPLPAGAPAEATGDLFFPVGAVHRDSPGLHRHFRIAAPSAPKSDPSVRLEWMRALADHLAGTGGAWGTFASLRLRALADAQDPAASRKPGARVRPLPRAGVGPATPPMHGELADLMETTTGTTAVQEALQQNRTLFLQIAKEKASVPIDRLKLPPIARHPWARMLARVGAPPAEPLATMAPAEFYYVRAASLPSLFALLDQVDAWGTPAANLLDGRPEDRDVAARYEAQLGLRRGPLTRTLGPSVLGEVALVGSDPYVKEGSDVTVMLRVKDRTLLDVALAATLAELEQKHGKLTQETRDHSGVTVRVARSADGAVRQQRASSGDVELVSNSAQALDAVLDADQNRRARLADEPDFRYMLARDASVHADVLAYLGDRFVAEVVGPKQKVLEARREIALGELTGPGFAALLHGVVQGKSPAKVDDLFATGLLGKDEMVHADGAPIAWQPGVAARSAWGTPSSMTPLIDLPAPTQVTPSEQASYERFARAYQERWSSYIDPVALRVSFDDAGKTVTADLRELPLIDATEYSEAADFVGDSRLKVRALDRGARIVAGIGADSSMRRELAENVSGFAHDLKLDWIGDWVAVGVADRGVWAQLVDRYVDKLPQVPSPDDDRANEIEMERFATVPVYVELALRSPVQAALALAGLRVMAERTIPGMFEWGEVARHRDVPIVRIELKKSLTRELRADSPALDVFYAVTDGAILVTLQQWLIERLIDEQLDGAGPTTAHASEPDSTQLDVEIGSSPGKGLWSCMAWLLEREVLMSGELRSRGVAEALFRGAPELAADAAAVRALGLAYFGASPVTADGAAYSFTREGARDPARGTDDAPVWPSVPVAGSPVAKVMNALARVRTQEAFDDEGKDDQGKPMRSLHARATFGLF